MLNANEYAACWRRCYLHFMYSSQSPMYHDHWRGQLGGVSVSNCRVALRMRSFRIQYLIDRHPGDTTQYQLIRLGEAGR